MVPVANPVVPAAYPAPDKILTTTVSEGSTNPSAFGAISNVAVADPDAKVICGVTSNLVTNVSKEPLFD